MSLLYPAALALSVLALPIILLYLLRLRRREVKISSTLLWTQLTLDRLANSPWQKLHRNILLLLQLLILAGLVFALTRPVLPTTSSVEGNVIVLLDISASMMATDEVDGASRFESAIGVANELIDDLGANDTMTIITAGNNPDVLAATAFDRGQLREVINTLMPESGPADWPGALALAAGLSQSVTDPQVVIISDGGLPDDLPQLPGNITFMPVGQSGENLGITAHGTRSTGEASELLVEITNFANTDARATVSLYVDDLLFDSRSIGLQPHDNTQLSWILPDSASTIETRLVPDVATSDYLEVDNTAWGIVNNRPSRSVYLVSEGNLFIERLFSVLPGYNVTRSADYPTLSDSEDGKEFDLFIFDGVPMPNTLPPGNILLIDPQQPTESDAGNPHISVTGHFTDTTVTEVIDSPLLEHVNWGEISVSEAVTVNAPSLTPIIKTAAGPLLLAGAIEGRRIVVFPFDLEASDLPIQIAFPVIMANIVNWLIPNGVLIGESDTRPGDIVTLIPDVSVESIVIESPGGDVWEETINANDGLPINFQTQQPGIYNVFYRDAYGELSQAGRFNVNLVNMTESDILPKGSLRLGSSTVPSTTPAPGLMDMWPIFLGMALLFMLFEWWMTYRRPGKTPLARIR